MYLCFYNPLNSTRQGQFISKRERAKTKNTFSRPFFLYIYSHPQEVPDEGECTLD